MSVEMSIEEQYALTFEVTAKVHHLRDEMQKSRKRQDMIKDEIRALKDKREEERGICGALSREIDELLEDEVCQ